MLLVENVNNITRLEKIIKANLFTSLCVIILGLYRFIWAQLNEIKMMAKMVEQLLRWVNQELPKTISCLFMVFSVLIFHNFSLKMEVVALLCV